MLLCVARKLGEMQKNSVISRKANREARERLKLTAAEMKVDVEELANDVSAVGCLKVMKQLKSLQH